MHVFVGVGCRTRLSLHWVEGHMGGQCRAGRRDEHRSRGRLERCWARGEAAWRADYVERPRASLHAATLFAYAQGEYLHD